MVGRQKKEVLSIYRSLLRAARDLPAYNFREYALEKIRYEFRTNKSLQKDEITVNDFLTEARKNLEMIKRQSLIQKMYEENVKKLVVE